MQRQTQARSLSAPLQMQRGLLQHLSQGQAPSWPSQQQHQRARAAAGTSRPRGARCEAARTGSSSLQQNDRAPAGDAAAPSASAAPGGAASPPFDWTRAWYPLLPTSYLEDRSRPRAVVLLGRALVVWWHAPTSSWHCFEDRCPHRLTALSEGRLDPASGDLQCAYHGWAFGPDGRCTAIPQADDPQQEAAALGSPRACVASYPVREEQGMLWVWPDSGPGARQESAACQVALPTELADGSGLLLGDWYCRELPISYEYLAENLVDPSHVNFAHHNVIGSRDRAGPIRLRQEGGLSARGGFAVSMVAGDTAAGAPATTRFVPPSLIWLSFEAGAGAAFSMVFYAVPVSPGRSRLLAGYSTTAAPALVKQALGSGALAPLLHAFQFLGDLGSHRVLDGDAILLRYQEEQIARSGGSAPYFLPASCDRGVVLLRKWLAECAGGGPSYGAAVPPGPQAAHLTREQILDRYEQHTRDCPHCSRALQNVRAVRGGLSTAATSSLAASLVLAALLPPALFWPLPIPPLPLPGAGGRARAASAPLLLLSAALAAGLAGQALGRLEEELTYTDYRHATK